MADPKELCELADVPIEVEDEPEVVTCQSNPHVRTAICDEPKPAPEVK
jgi:hypothetical protein